MLILAIDPGSTKSAYVKYLHGDSQNKNALMDFGILENCMFLGMIDKCMNIDLLAIEMPACYGMAVGATVFETCLWVGRFIDRFVVKHCKPYYKVYRKQQNHEKGIDSVCMHLCKNNRAKDANIRQSILDRYPCTGGGKIPQIGTKKQPGPLYGVSKDIWAALAVAITFAERPVKIL